MFEIKTKNDFNRIIDAINLMKHDLTQPDGLLRQTVDEIRAGLIKQNISRYQREFPNRQEGGPDIISALKHAGSIVEQLPDHDLVLAMFDEEALDRLTRLPPTIVTKSTFSLWRLLRAGFGMLGSHDPNKGHIGRKLKEPYINYILALQWSSLFQETGVKVHPPWPDLVEMASFRSGLLVIRKKGFEGRDWFLKNGNLFLEDRRLIEAKLENTMNKIFDQSLGRL